MNTKILKKISHKLGHVLIFPFAFLVLTLFVISGFQYFYSSKIYPNIYISKINLSGLTKNEAKEKLAANIDSPSSISLLSGGQVFTLQLKSVNFAYDFDKSTENAIAEYRSGYPLNDIYNSLKGIFKRKDIPLEFRIDNDKLSKNISVIAGQVSQEPEHPFLALDKGKVVVNRGKPGSDLDQEKLIQTILSKLSKADFSDVSIPVVPNDPSLNESEAYVFKARGERLLGKRLNLKFEYQTFSYTDDDIFALLDAKKGYKDTSIFAIIQSISKQINREPQNSSFVFDEGKVKEFAPAKDGVEVDDQKFLESIRSSISSLELQNEKVLTSDIPVRFTPPKVQTSDVNNLGIRELIGRGTSKFFHSIPSRVHNVILASSRINRTLVAPGETLSFNDALGDVSQFTGYQQAYIIKDGKTILGDGGGVCQVSTTLFRAALDAGLPIVERRGHAYRVGYYEQDSPPGIDATVFSPSTDLKIKNDTPGHILIQTYADPKKYSLVFEIYGTSDGRVATTTKPIISSQTPPPPDLYQDDPTLPLGTVKQIDFKAWGAKVSFNYKVERGGQVIYEKTFLTNYRPWQAIYLRGTKQ